MAGYDFTFTTNKTLREVAQDWLRKYKKYTKRYKLDFSYSTKLVSNNKIEIYGIVDGKLWAMQHLHRHMPEIMANYINFSQFGSYKAKNLLYVFYKSNQEGLKSITNMVGEIAKQLKAKPGGPILSNDLHSKIEIQSPRKRDIKSLRSMISALDGWILKTLSDKQAIILCDQSMEEWLKARLRLNPKNKDNYNKLINKGLSNFLIDKMEAYRLVRFHRARNRVQHRGRKALPKTIASMFHYYVALANKYM